MYNRLKKYYYSFTHVIQLSLESFQKLLGGFFMKTKLRREEKGKQEKFAWPRWESNPQPLGY
jgi:hypothetical protein